MEGKSIGPFSMPAMTSLWEDGTLAPDAKCWRVGLLRWHPMRELDELLKSQKGAPVETPPPAPVDPLLNAGTFERAEVLPPSQVPFPWLAVVATAMISGALVAAYFLLVR
jgi:hypothetical protein